MPPYFRIPAISQFQYPSIFSSIGHFLIRLLQKTSRTGPLLVAVDRGQVLVVEVKNKLDKRMVDKFLEEKLPRFKALFPEYEKYQVVGGMGALVVKDDVGKYAEKAGLYVLTQTDKGGAMLLNGEGFEPKAFN